MSKKNRTSLEVRVGEPLPNAHLKRLKDSTVEHSKRAVANKIFYPDPESVTESDLFDPRVEAVSPSVESESATRTNTLRPNCGAKGDQ